MTELTDTQKEQLRKTGRYTRYKKVSTDDDASESPSVRRWYADRYDADSGNPEPELKMPRKAYYDRDAQIERNIGGSE